MKQPITARVFKGTYNVYSYESPEELMSDTYSDVMIKLSSHTGSQRFTGTKTYQDMIELISGKVQAVNLIEDVKRNIEKIIEKTEISTQYDVAGSYVDVARMLSGDPENMVEFTTIEKANRYCTIIYSGVESSQYSSDDVIKKGAVMASLVDCLENNGIRCAVYGMYAIDFQSSKNAIALVQLKKYNEPFHENKINLFHVSFFRRAIFGFIEAVYDYNPPSGYGGPTRYPIAQSLSALAQLTGAGSEEEVISIDNFITDQDLLYKIQSKDYTSLGAYLSEKLTKIQAI